MDWEQKFSSIIGETECNLDRAKEKMRGRHIVGSGNRTFDSTFYSRRGSNPDDCHSLAMMQYPVSSTPKSVKWRKADNHLTSMYEDADTYTLCGKLEQQNKTIDQLNNLVRVMERERDEYKHQISELKYEVRELSKHVANKDKEENLQRQITKLKNDICKEVEAIRDQVQFYKIRHESHSQSHEYREDTNFTKSHSKDISDIRQVMRDELEYVSTDMDALRHRLGLVEAEILSKGVDKNSSRLYKVMDRLSDNRRLLHETRDIIPNTLSDKTLDKFEINNLRLNVTDLKERLYEVEEKLHQSLTYPKPSSSRMLSASVNTLTSKSYKTANSDIDLDELELSDDKFEDSDDLDSDLDDLEEDGAPEMTSTRRRNLSKKTVDDLDFELMKLSEKDEISGDISDDSDDLDNILDDLQ